MIHTPHLCCLHKLLISACKNEIQTKLLKGGNSEDGRISEKQSTKEVPTTLMHRKTLLFFPPLVFSPLNFTSFLVLSFTECLLANMCRASSACALLTECFVLLCQLATLSVIPFSFFLLRWCGVTPPPLLLLHATTCLLSFHCTCANKMRRGIDIIAEHFVGIRQYTLPNALLSPRLEAG